MSKKRSFDTLNGTTGSYVEMDACNLQNAIDFAALRKAELEAGSEMQRVIRRGWLCTYLSSKF